jgi:hypothetical protein
VIASTPKLTVEQVRTVVTNVMQMSADLKQAAHVPGLLDGAEQKFGLHIDLAQRRWQLPDGHSGSTAPFSVDVDSSAHSMNDANPLSDQALRRAFAVLLQLQRSEKASSVSRMIVDAAKLGVDIDLAAGRWSAADGRAGTTDPFSIDQQAPACAAVPVTNPCDM